MFLHFSATASLAPLGETRHSSGGYPKSGVHVFVVSSLQRQLVDRALLEGGYGTACKSEGMFQIGLEQLVCSKFGQEECTLNSFSLEVLHLLTFLIKIAAENRNIMHRCRE